MRLRDRNYKLIVIFLATIAAIYPYQVAQTLPSNTIAENLVNSESKSQRIVEFRVQNSGTESQLTERKILVRELEIELKKLEYKGDLAAIKKLEIAIAKANREISSLFGATQIDDRDIDYATQESFYRVWSVRVNFTNNGAKKFAKITQELAGTGRSLGIFYKGKLISYPTISDEYKKKGITGGLAIIEGNFDEKKSYEIAKQINESPDRTPAQKAALKFISLIRTGEAKFNRQDFTGAIASFEEAIKIDSKNARGYLARGRAKAGLQKWEEAIANYQQAITIEPNNVNAYWFMARAKEELKDPNGAIADYEKIRQISKANPDNSSQYVYLFYPYLAKSYVLQGKKQELLDLADDVYQEPYLNNFLKGSSLVELEDYRVAISYFNKAIAIEPKLTLAYFYRAIAWDKLSQQETAIWDKMSAKEASIKDYQQVISLTPTYLDENIFPSGSALESYAAGLHYQRAVAYSALGNWKDALKDLDKSISIKPNDASAYRQRSLVRQKLNDEAGAKQDADKAAELSATDGAIDFPF